jgi:hypothetical protein
MSRTLQTLLAIAALLVLSAPGTAMDLCADATGASAAEEFLTLLQAAPAPEIAELPAGGLVQKAAWCTKEQCSAARAECRQWCPFPCSMQFECTTPYCGSCISCSC